MRALPLKGHCAICAIARKTNQNHTLPTTGLAGDLHIHSECDFVMSVLKTSLTECIEKSSDPGKGS
jgi:hypothetical protein